MDLTNRNSFFRIHAGGIFSLLVVIFGISDSLLLPTHRELVQSENTLNFILAKADALNKNMSALELQKSQMLDHHNSFERRFDSIDEAELDPLEWLQTQATKTEVTINSFQDQRNNIVNSLPAVDITLEASGTYQQICQLLNNLERSPRACFINELTIDTNIDSALVCHLRMRVLVFPLDKQLREELENHSHTDSASLSANNSDAES